MGLGKGVSHSFPLSFPFPYISSLLIFLLCGTLVEFIFMRLDRPARALCSTTRISNRSV
ncbi:hypothetical protein BDQ94DRAFT_142313 [Aspergillus welwitschiae]|uniref:Uncharacterized protein n=1 Tax=Aspergillus welwitschiae TaxID=1341132 RepID=A0A3F3Q5M0_9EURO|nr:hypothetical protein BDQ94DRAFT_142313 [Aspergillus welwitschiae]RDH34222.1 hypothetical protein BDQ94DRAFT_142313 [Aspergillus welwitschiae]